MTVLFTGSKEGNKKKYKKIIKVLDELNVQVKTRDLLTEVSSKKLNSFKRDLEMADFMVAEVSETSLSLGLEIATALSKSKHVLILTDNNKSLDDLSDFIRDNSSRYAHVSTYNLENIKTVLSESMKKIRKQLNYVLYVELPNKYGDMIEDMQKNTNKSKKEIIQEALKEYFPEVKDVDEKP
jgi:hypothetical protein